MNFGLALGGGGLRGAVHIGFLEVLLREGIRPDIVSGTSAGAIVAGLYASGIGPENMPKLLFDKTAFYSYSLQKKLSLIPSGLIRGNKLEFIFNKTTGNKYFSDAKTPLAITATNITDGAQIIFTSEELVEKSTQADCIFLSEYKIAEAIRASISIPGVFQPKKLDNFNLVDGGLVNNVPADTLKFMGVNKVIAVNLGFSFLEEKNIDSMPEILVQTIDIMGEKNSKYILDNYADYTVNPKTEAVSLWQFNKVPGLIQIGRNIAAKNLRNIKEIIY